MHLSNEEFFEISRGLEQYHALFYSLWEMGKPIFTDSIPTAAVEFNNENDKVQFLFNPEFWKKLDKYNREFIICHETLHVALNHGLRAKDAEQSERYACNVAMDLVVNHLLVNKFSFDRHKIKNQQEFCWVDTVFPNGNVPDDLSFEEYFNKIIKKVGERAKKGTGKLVDDHSPMIESGKDLAKGIKQLDEDLNNEEKESIKDMIDRHFNDNKNDNQEDTSRSSTGTGSWTFVKVERVKIKRKWETVIKKWSKKHTGYKDTDQWVRLNRRFTFMSNDLMLPTTMEIDDREDKKISVFFFLDGSGSCISYKDRFFKAAQSLSPDRFDLRLFCFDTKVQEITLDGGKFYGGGGTRFDIIENYIQELIKKEGIKYPKAVWILTDLFGNKVVPKYPERWYWFAVYGMSKYVHSYVPTGSKVFDLRNFV